MGTMDDDMEYKVKLIMEDVQSKASAADISICKLSPKGLLLIIGISLILILAVPYSGIFSPSRGQDDKHQIVHPPQQYGLKNHKVWKPKLISLKQCKQVATLNRIDCYPEPGGDQQKCTDRGCCWKDVNNKRRKSDSGGNPPSCFYPPSYPSYKTNSGIRVTDYGYSADLVRAPDLSPYPMDIMTLKVDVYLETQNRVHFKIYDPNDARYEVPVPTPKVTKKATDASYRIEFTQNPFGIAVIRNCGDVVLFNSSIAPLIYADQFIQLSSTLVSRYIYGLGERRSSLLLSSQWKTYTIWTEDTDGSVKENHNLYGSHPFFLNMDPNTGQAYGVFLLNSNAMDITVQPTPAITYRTIGGILDFYIFLGPTPGDVISQYTEVIGRPFMPPYWGLGFHLCRWGYMTANNTWDMVKRMRALGIPQDVQWNDIEYAEGNKIFTYNNSTFANLPDFVQDLHDHGQHYIQIVDPGIHNETGYSPYDTGLEKDVFVTDRDGETFIGAVWPGTTAFPDFFDEATIEWWKQCAADYHKEIQFDGMWIDMNEPSNMYSNGSIVDGCPNEEPYDNLPYTPAVFTDSLIFQSFCLSSRHHNHGTHYDLHSLYGLSMIKATHDALTLRGNKRPFVITRSTYPSSGHYGGHWLGDNTSEWPDVYFSIPGILNFNMFGIPLIGADICGFNGNSNEALCQRWTQLGAFYPFSRNHNSLWCAGQEDNCEDQDPTVFSEAMQNSTRKVLLTRYSLLPYLYTLFYRAHINGTTVARPLFFEYPNDTLTYSVDRQFLWGPALLISPVLEESKTSLLAVFPKGRWYDFYNGSEITVSTTSEVHLKAPLDHINLHVRAGYILPTQQPEITTTLSRFNPFRLVVALEPVNGSACGELYWDDGDSVDSLDTGKYTYMTFEAVGGNTIQSNVVKKDGPELHLESVIVYGVMYRPNAVKVNGMDAKYEYDIINKVLTIDCNAISMQVPFTIKWTTDKRTAPKNSLVLVDNITSDKTKARTQWKKKLSVEGNEGISPDIAGWKNKVQHGMGKTKRQRGLKESGISAKRQHKKAGHKRIAKQQDMLPTG